MFSKIKGCIFLKVSLQFLHQLSSNNGNPRGFHRTWEIPSAARAWNQPFTLLSVRISMAFFRSKSLIFRWNSCDVSRTAARLVAKCWQNKVFLCKTSHFSKMATVVSTSGLFSITSSVPVSWPALATYIYMYIYIYLSIYMYIYMIFLWYSYIHQRFSEKKKQFMCSDNENQDFPHGASFVSANCCFSEANSWLGRPYGSTWIRMVCMKW